MNIQRSTTSLTKWSHGSLRLLHDSLWECLHAHVVTVYLSCVSADSPAPNRRVLGDTIVLHNTKPSDSAVYQCEASNRHGTLLSNANIMIMSKCDYLWLHFQSFSVSLCFVAVSHCNKNHLEASDRRSKSGAGAEEGVLPTHSIIQARASPHRATSQSAAIYMLTSFPSIPHGNQGHKTNMCCFTSADKKDRMLLSSCFAHIWGGFFSLTPELIKLDAL